MSQLLAPLRNHRAFQAVADPLADYVGIERDLVQFLEFVSLAAGRMVMPINLDVLSDNLTVDLHVANRILDLRSDYVTRVDTHREFRALERALFLVPGNHRKGDLADALQDARPLSVVMLRGNHRVLHRDTTEYTARLLRGDVALPSIWRVSDHGSVVPPVPSTLRIQTTQTCRGLSEFGSAFSVLRTEATADILAGLIDALPCKPKCSCVFRRGFQGYAPPDQMMIFERVLCVLASCRAVCDRMSIQPLEISLGDYAAARSLVTSLPLAPIDRRLSPQALLTAERLFETLDAPSVGIELPDLSGYGHKWFTRGDAVHWTGLAYNTIKNHLRQLEGEGLLRSTIVENNREKGRQIHFQFADNRVPPFAWKNPFEGLPPHPTTDEGDE